MSKMPNLLLTSFPRLTRLFFLCMCCPILCFSPILFLLFLGVWVEFRVPSFVLQDPSNHPKLGKLFIYPLIKLFETWYMNWRGSFLSCCPISVCIIFEGVVHVIEKFLFPVGGLWWVIGFLFNRNIFVPHVHLIFTIHGKIHQPFVFTNV